MRVNLNFLKQQSSSNQISVISTVTSAVILYRGASLNRRYAPLAELPVAAEAVEVEELRRRNHAMPASNRRLFARSVATYMVLPSAR